MAVAYDNSTTLDTVTGSSTRSTTHTTNSDVLSAIVVWVGLKDAITSDAPTCDGITMTTLASLDGTTTSSCKISMYGLVGQAAGSNSIQVLNLSDPTENLFFGVISVTGADPTGGAVTFKNAATAVGATSTSSFGIPSNWPGDFIVQGYQSSSASAPSIVAGTGTQRWGVNAGVGYTVGATQPGGLTTVVIAYTGWGTSMNTGWVTAGCAIKTSGTLAVGEAPNANVRLLGVGAAG